MKSFPRCGDERMKVKVRLWVRVHSNPGEHPHSYPRSVNQHFIDKMNVKNRTLDTQVGPVVNGFPTMAIELPGIGKDFCKRLGEAIVEFTNKERRHILNFDFG